jgi:hypothetical protein
MGLFSGMLSKRPIEFAGELAEKIVRQFPPTSEPLLAKKGAQRRLESVIEHVMGDLDAFQKDVQLGWIGKARLGNAFRWKLIDRGYSKQFVEALTAGIIRYIAGKRAV